MRRTEAMLGRLKVQSRSTEINDDQLVAAEAHFDLTKQFVAASTERREVSFGLGQE